VSQSKPIIHAIILALNEEPFIKVQLDTIYPFCNRISIITQYDRDWYGQMLTPDATVSIILNYPDPDGKINLVIRRLPDEAAARNMEMLSFNRKSFIGVKSHGASLAEINDFHSPPDYFWIIDSDEIYDSDTLPAIIDYLVDKRPRGMRMTGYNYLRNWNRRVPREIIDFTHFGFLKPGLLFEQRRVISWNESRLSKLLKMLRLPDISSKLFGFITCPEEVGVFHHGCWLGGNDRIRSKFNKSSHVESKRWEPSSVDECYSQFIPTEDLPVNIKVGQWPKNFFDITNE
jgi:hypothetical protein